jgi:gliding motility-associated-like protein
MKRFGNPTLRRKFLACLIVLLPAWYSADGQSCDCPAIAACGACVGGLTSLSLQFNGAVTSTIVVSDQTGAVFNGQVNPGETFSFTGSIINEKFVGPQISVSINGVPNAATISSSCSGFAIGQVFGSLTVRAARSKSGGPICCPSTLMEKTAPTFQNCPSDIALTLPYSECTVAASWTKPLVSDNCGLASLTSTHEPDQPFRAGATVVTYTAKDIYGNVSICAFTVTVSDTEPPVISSCPSDITVSADASCEAIVSWNPPDVSDNCKVTLESIPSSGSTFPLGITPVIYTATDSVGNKSTCTFNVIVENDENPVILSCPGDTVIYDEGNGQATASWIEPTATASCGSITTTKTHSPGSTFSIGKAQVQYDFTDDLGKVSTCLFNVEVRAAEVLLVVQQVLTPDGDGVNDRWLLPNIEKSVANTVVVLDRWGNKVFDRRGYDNQNVYWDGTNASGKVVPTGTYFYSIEIQTGSTVVKKTGFLEVIQ